MGFGMFGLMDTLFPIFFTVIFFIVIGAFIVTVVKRIGEWNKNNHSPVLTVDAAVVSKRESHSHHHHNDANGFSHTTTSTRYYATFEVASGDRMELNLSGREYGMLAEGDRGKLTFQGTRYKGFERII